ncbi:MAG TPA: PLP-dependent aminotransferase family protein [Dokdonella sp.]|uniref:aminotransferase-like domain-containing protein n=1 Tax=Dokdonella sp. TaxID=2291710 RepID=UPI002D80FF19|nr:PLP-dependent aminotransferase family protein [Dokdonella sp.]HET9032871.1 PLP-dependent aminotransferase family protein [Dokdonella sp.]
MIPAHRRDPRSMDDLNIVLDPATGLSLQHQLRQKLIDAIHRGVLEPGRRLPSTRSLAERIGVSRNTVSLAYDALLADGHIVSRPRSGIFVASDVPKVRIASGRRGSGEGGPLAARLPTAPDDRGFRCPRNWHQYPFPFIDGCVDSRLMPNTEWREALRLASSRHEIDAINRSANDTDDAMLIDEVRSKVLPMRGIDADADEVLLTLSARHALQLIGSLLVERGTPVVLEAPVDAEFERRMRDRHAELSMLDDHDGKPLPQRAVVVTSARRSSAADSDRPRALLARVAEADAVLVEHDMPPGARDGSNVPPALRALDEEGRVVHVGTLSPAVSCGESPGIIVSETAFIERLRQLRRIQGTLLPALLQRAWAYFIGLGHYSAGLVRSGRVLEGRRTALRDGLNHYLHQRVSIETLPGASAYWVRLPENLDTREFARAAAEIGVLVEPTRLEGGREALCMGVTGIDEARIRDGVKNLSRLIRGDLAETPRHLDDEPIVPLRGAALRRTLAGATLLYNTVYGEPATLEVRANGELDGTAGHAGEDCDSGRWWIDDGRWYRQWRRWAYAEVSAYRVVVDGDRLRWYGEDGLLADTAVITRQGRRKSKATRRTGLTT